LQITYSEFGRARFHPGESIGAPDGVATVIA